MIYDYGLPRTDRTHVCRAARVQLSRTIQRRFSQPSTKHELLKLAARMRIQTARNRPSAVPSELPTDAMVSKTSSHAAEDHESEDSVADEPGHVQGMQHAALLLPPVGPR